MHLSPSSARLWLVTGTALFAASALVVACGGEIGPADGNDSSMDATGGTSANASTGTSRSGSTFPKGRGGVGNNPAQAMGAAYNTAQGGAKVTGIPGPDSGTTVTVGQGGRSPREPEPGEPEKPGKVGAAGAPKTVGPTPAQGGVVGTTMAGPTCRNNVHDGDSCNPSYDLAECVVRTARICVCDAKKKVWQCRAYDANTGGAASVGGQAAVAGSNSNAGGKHGGNEPVAGQPANHLAGAAGR